MPWLSEAWRAGCEVRSPNMGCDTLLAQHTAPPESVMATKTSLPSKSRDCSLAAWERGGEARHVWAMWGPPGHSGVSVQTPGLPILGRPLNPMGDGTTHLIDGQGVSPGAPGGCREAEPSPGLPAVLGQVALRPVHIGTVVASPRSNRQTQG